MWVYVLSSMGNIRFPIISQSQIYSPLPNLLNSGVLALECPGLGAGWHLLKNVATSVRRYFALRAVYRRKFAAALITTKRFETFPKTRRIVVSLNEGRPGRRDSYIRIIAVGIWQIRNRITTAINVIVILFSSFCVLAFGSLWKSKIKNGIK